MEERIRIIYVCRFLRDANHVISKYVKNEYNNSDTHCVCGISKNVRIGSLSTKFGFIVVILKNVMVAFHVKIDWKVLYIFFLFIIKTPLIILKQYFKLHIFLN